MKRIVVFINIVFYLLTSSVNCQSDIKIVIEKINLIEVNFPDSFSKEISEITDLVNKFTEELDKEILFEINNRYNKIVKGIIGFNYLSGSNEKPNDSLKLASLEELLQLRIQKISNSYWSRSGNVGRNKLNTLYNYFDLKRETPSGFWDPSKEINPLEIFDSKWVNRMVELDQMILKKREQEWELIPSHTKRFFQIREEKKIIVLEQERLRGKIKNIMSRVNIMDGEKAYAHELNPLKERANQLEDNINFLTHEREGILSNLSINEIPEMKRIENLFYHEIFTIIPKEILLIN